MKPVAVFPGSFNPFTIGHLSILQRSLPLFSKVIVAIGFNNSKQETDSNIDNRIEEIRRVIGDCENIEVTSYSGLTAIFARNHGASFIIRGVRDVADFEYERRMADINRQLTGVETILLYSLPELASISSSIVRELESYDADVSKFLPSK